MKLILRGFAFKNTLKHVPPWNTKLFGDVSWAYSQSFLA